MLLTRWQHGMYLEKLCVFLSAAAEEKGGGKKKQH